MNIENCIMLWALSEGLRHRLQRTGHELRMTVGQYGDMRLVLMNSKGEEVRNVCVSNFLLGNLEVLLEEGF